MVYWMNFKLMRLIERLNLSWHINVIVKYEVISTLTEQNIRNSLSWHGPGISMRRDGVKLVL
jgi:hypothetical protein